MDYIDSFNASGCQGRSLRLNRLDLNLLVCLDAFLIEKSVTKAAEKVFLSQSAMSCALRRLREYFDDEILVQVGRTMVLSPFAQSLEAPVRDALVQMQAISERRPHFDPSMSDRTITLEVSDYVATVLLPRVLESAAKSAPRMHFGIRLIDEPYAEDLEHGTVDLLIVPEALACEGHPSEALFHDAWACVVWSENPLVGKSISLEQFLDLGHVVTEWGGGRLTALDETILKGLGHERRREITAPSFNLTPQLVVGTSRIATVQSRLAAHMARHWPLRVLACPVPMPRIVEVVQWHKHKDRDPAIIWMRKLLNTLGKELSRPRARSQESSPSRQTSPRRSAPA
jgi:LysR family transcriptional regulator, nod-box dependent transcriptional activator